MRKWLPVAVILATMLVVVAALLVLPRSAMRPAAKSQGPASDQTPHLIIISIQNEGIQSEFKRAFAEWHLAQFGAKCEIEWHDHGGTSQALRFVKSEFAASPDGIGVDMLWGGGIEPYIQLAGLGLLEPIALSKEVASALPESVGGVPLQGPKHEWYGTALSGFGIIYNKPRLAELKLPEPKTWTDLAAPQFFGEVCAADPRASGTAQAMVEVILEAYGWEKGFGVLTRIGGNVKSFSRSSGEVPKLVSMGDVASGMAIDFYGWTQVALDGREKIGYVLPAGVTPLTPDGIGVLRGAPNAQSAKRFLDFLLSPDGQRLWVLPKGYPGGPVTHELLRIPVLPEVYRKYAAVTNVLFDPSRAASGFRYDPVKASARRDALKDLYGAIIVDLAPELASAWKGVIRRGLKPDEVKKLCAPPMSEQELMTLARTGWSNPAVRNNTLTEWAKQARERYRALARSD